ncbi:hypothetical protein HED60_14585 [Planctomycetales bacterium ZRK34]|nr:hypothetical protein HED60_14585 [Planctomycetales bacterium ZRK34]
MIRHLLILFVLAAGCFAGVGCSQYEFNDPTSARVTMIHDQSADPPPAPAQTPKTLP